MRSGGGLAPPRDGRAWSGAGRLRASGRGAHGARRGVSRRRLASRRRLLVRRRFRTLVERRRKPGVSVRGGGAGAKPAGSRAGVLRRGAPPRLSVPLGSGLAGVFGAAHIGGRRGADRLAWARDGAPGFIRRGFPGSGRVGPGGTRPRAHRFANHGVDRGRAHPPHETARPRGSPRLLRTRRRDHGGRERAQRPRALGTRRHAQPPRRARSPAGRRRAREARPRQRAREDRRGPRDPDRKSGGFLGPPGLRVWGNDHRAPARDFGLQKEAARRGGGPRERRTEFQERVRAIGAGSASSNRGSPSTRACRSRRRSATGGPGRPCRSNARRALPA